MVTRNLNEQPEIHQLRLNNLSTATNLMIKYLLGLTVLSQTLMFAPIAIAQAAWREVARNEVGDRFLVDQNSIERNGAAVWYWEYREFEQPNNAFVPEAIEQPVYGVNLYQSVDCAARTARLRRITVYGSDRQVLRRINYGDTGSLAEPRPGSSAATVLEYVCSQPPQG